MLTITSNSLDRPQETTEIIPEISPEQYLSEVIRLLKKEEDTVFGREGINNNRILCARLDDIVELLGDKNRRSEALRFLSEFNLVEKAGKKEVEDFLDRLHKLEDINIKNRQDDENPIGVDAKSQYRKLEILREVFSAFGVTKAESITGIPSKPTNLILKIYEGHIVDKYYGRGMIDFDKFLDYDDFDSTEGILFFGLRKGTKLTGTGELISEVVEIVDEIHRDNSGDNGEGENHIKSSQPRESWKKMGSERRRNKSKEDMRNARENRELEAKKNAYQQALGRLENLGLNIDQQLAEFSGFLIEHIPFVGEVVQYLEMLSEISRLTQELQKITESLKEGSRSDEIGDMERELIKLDGDISFYEGELNIAKGRLDTETQKENPVTLVISNTNSSIRNYTRKKTKAIREKERLANKIRIGRRKEEERVQENATRIGGLTTQANTIHIRIKALDTIIQKGRIKKVPTLDEFISGFYTSLRAQEFYTIPNTPTEMEISLNWVESNIVDLLVRILENLDSLDEQIIVEGISLPEIVELARDIGGIDTTDSGYNIESLPDISSVSQSKVAELISYFKKIIPADTLETVPTLTSNKNPEENKKPKKTKSEKRRESIKNSGDTQKEKEGIRNTIESLEEQQKRFRKYWELKIGVLETDLRGISRAVNGININEPLRNGKFKGKDIDELILLSTSKSKELESLRVTVNSPELDNDNGLFEKIRKDIIRLQKRLSKIK